MFIGAFHRTVGVHGWFGRGDRGLIGVCRIAVRGDRVGDRASVRGVTPPNRMAETFEGGTSCQYHNHNNQANIANISNTLI